MYFCSMKSVAKEKNLKKQGGNDIEVRNFTQGSKPKPIKQLTGQKGECTQMTSSR